MARTIKTQWSFDHETSDSVASVRFPRTAGGGGDPGPGPGDNDILTITGATNTAFNKVYTRIEDDFIYDDDFFGLKFIVDTTTTTHAVYSYYTGSIYYIVAWDSVAGEWVVTTDSVNPQGIADDATYGTISLKEVLTTDSEDDGSGISRPDSSDANISYS